MAVNDSTGFSGPYTANGATTSFPFSFPVQSAADVAVEIDGEDTTSVFTVSVNADQSATPGGTVAFATAPTTGTLIVYSKLCFDQSSAFEVGVQWNSSSAKAANSSYDRAALRDQMMRRDVGRALLVPLGESPPRMGSLAGAADGQVIGFVDGKLVPVDNSAAAAQVSALAAQDARDAATQQAQASAGSADAAAGALAQAQGQATIAGSSAAAAQLSANNAASAASQAFAALGIQSILGSTPAALPFEVTAISGGIGTGSGGTPGTYAGGVSGGPSGFQWTYTIDSTGKLGGYTIVNHGISTSNNVPTLSLPGGGLTGATVPTATVGTIPVNRMFAAPSNDGSQLLAWGNSAGGLATAPFGGTQISIPLATFINRIFQFFAINSTGDFEWIDRRGRIGARLNADGFEVAGSVAAKTVSAPKGTFENVGVGGHALLTSGPDGFTVTDRRGRIGLWLKPDGTLVAPSISGTGSGGSKATPTVRRRIASNHGGWRPPATLTVSNGTTQLTGTDRFSWTPNTDVRNVELALLNATVGAAGLLAPVGNALEVVVALEAARSYSLVYPDLGGCSGLPISSGGRSGYFIGDGAMVITRPEHTGVLTKGLTQYYRIHKRVSAGQVWPLNASAGDFTWGGVTTTDAVMGSSIKDGSDQTQAFSQSGWDAFAAPTNLKTIGAFQATAIIAEQITPAPVVMIAGDSNADGYGGSALGRSYLTRGLDAQGVAWYNCGNPGSNMVALALNYGPMILLADYVDHIIIHCGTNDIYGTGPSPTLSAFQTNLLQLAKEIARPNVKLWFCTIPPRTTSADWTTYSGQSVITSIATNGTDTFEVLRVKSNNWLRDASSAGALAFLRNNLPYGAAQVGGIIDSCLYIERNNDGSALTLDTSGQQTVGTGGLWLINATGDGIHMNDAGQAVAAAAVPAASAFAIS